MECGAKVSVSKSEIGTQTWRTLSPEESMEIARLAGANTPDIDKAEASRLVTSIKVILEKSGLPPDMTKILKHQLNEMRSRRDRTTPRTRPYRITYNQEGKIEINWL
eukprot:sb/3477734/